MDYVKKSHTPTATCGVYDKNLKFPYLLTENPYVFVLLHQPSEIRAFLVYLYFLRTVDTLFSFMCFLFFMSFLVSSIFGDA